MFGPSGYYYIYTSLYLIILEVFIHWISSMLFKNAHSHPTPKDMKKKGRYVYIYIRGEGNIKEIESRQ